MDDYEDSQDPNSTSEILADEALQSVNTPKVPVHSFCYESSQGPQREKSKGITIGSNPGATTTRKKQATVGKQLSPNTPRKSTPVKPIISPPDKGKAIAQNPQNIEYARDFNDDIQHFVPAKSSLKTRRQFLQTIQDEDDITDLTENTISVPDSANATHRKRRHLHSATESQDGINTESPHRREIVYTPLHEIKDYHGFFNIIVRITRAWYGKLYGKDRQRSLVFLVKDEEGTTMEVIATGVEADKWKSVVNAGQTYKIHDLMLGKTDKPFRVYRADDQLFVNSDTTIIPCADMTTIGTTPRYYHRLNRVKDLAGFNPCLFSTVGYVVDMTKWCRKEMADKTLIKMVEIYLIDQTSYTSPVVFTVWEDVLIKYGAKISNGFRESFMLIAHDVKAKKFAGEYRIESTGFTTLQFDVSDILEVKNLARWIHHEFPTLVNESDMQVAEPATYPRNMITIEELLEATEDPPAYKEVSIYDIVAAVSYIHINEELTYESCAKCRKKVPKSTRGEFQCENCDVTQSRPMTSFRVRAVLEDRTGQVTVVLFGSQAQLIMREPPQVIKTMQQKKTSSGELHKHIKDCLGIVYNFTIKLTNANHRYIQTNGYTIHNATRVLRNYKPRPPMLEILGARHSDSEVDMSENAEGEADNNEDATTNEDDK